jgi:hypothetical protein
MPPAVIAEPEPPQLERRPRTPPFHRRLAATLLRFVAVVAFSAMVGGGWYLANKGFGKKARGIIVEELHKRGVEASMRRLTLDPFRGLVAQDVRIYDFRNRENTIAVISEISLDINYAALFHRQPFLNALDVRNAELTLRIAQGDAKPLRPQLKSLNAHIYFPPDQIFVSQADGLFCGVRISATGQLIKREDQPTRETSPEEWARRVALLQRVVTELGRFSFPAGPPQLQLKFSGDVAQLEEALVEATLRGERLVRGKYEMRNLSAAAEWRDQRLAITQCEWSDNSGSFSGKASWTRSDGAGAFQARSTLEIKPFLDAFGFGNLLADAEFGPQPLIEGSGSATFDGAERRIEVIGRAAVDKFSYKKVPFERLTAEFSWDGARAMAREIRLQHRSGQITANILDAPNEFRLNVDSSIDPGSLLPLMPEAWRPTITEWEWQRPPAVHIGLRGPSRDPGTMAGEGTVALDHSRFRGIWMNSATAKLRLRDSAITVTDLHVERDEGTGTGSFTYDFAKHEVRITDVKANLRPAEVILWVEPKFWKAVVPYKFRQPPNVTANGVVQFHGRQNTHLELTVDAPTGLDYVFLGKNLAFDNAAARLLFTEGRLQLNDVKAALFSGTVAGVADISLVKGDQHYRADIAIGSIDFPALTDLYFGYHSAHGQLAGTFDFTGIGSDARTLRGNGKVQVTNGDVFAIPVFGPLSNLLNSISPGAGYSIARKATANFTISDGVIHTDNLNVAGKLFGMIGNGDLRFLDDKLDFNIRIDGSGAGAVLAPVYKLFEYKGEGSLSKPNWHPKRF